MPVGRFVIHRRKAGGKETKCSVSILQKQVMIVVYGIRKAQITDWNAIQAIYAGARKFMAQTGNPNQWGKDRPPEKTLEKDISEGNLYVLTRDGIIHGVFAFLLGEDPTYGYIDGAWRSNTPYGTIHRIASDGSGGVLKAAVAFCSGICPHIRIETHRDNHIMRERITRNGFQECGIIYLENGDPRIAYELLPTE